MRRRFFAVLVLLFTAIPSAAQRKEVTLDAVYDPTTRVYFSGTIHEDFKWIDDKTFVWPARDEKRKLVEWRLFDLTTGKTRQLYNRSKLQKALEEAGLSTEAAKSAGDDPDFEFDARNQAIVFEAEGDVFVYWIANGTVTRLTSTETKEEVPTFSPNGLSVAFVRNRDLYVMDVRTRQDRQITSTGSRTIINGRMDWLYEEEIFGRRNIRAYWWSPDSQRLVFLQLDEAGVPEYTVSDDIPYHPALNTYNYPKAGDRNPRARLFVASNAPAPAVPVNLDKYQSSDYLLVNVGWTDDSRAITYQVQNRQQTWLDLNSADPVSGTSRTIFRDSTKAWIDPIANPTWLRDGSFLWQSERSGWRHLYHYKPDGTLIRQVTSGEWEVRDLHGVDQKTRFIYFSGTERTHIGQDVYRVKLDGKGLQRLSAEPGTHVATFNPGATAYIDSWSDIRTPKQVRAYRGDGKLAAVIEENRVPAIAQYALPQPEFLQVRTGDGFPMEALIIRPPNFDPAREYPVFYPLYAGPHAQRVQNKWQGDSMLFNQVVANQGVIVWMCDNRTASGKGAVSAWPLHKELGAWELRDIEEGIAWLKQQPGVDGARIMLSGWSYGGFMVAYALTHSRSFIGGVAGAPVIDWRDYDTVYTERMLLTPQENPDGYRSSSPRWFAKDLTGKLLLLHGTTDDNVHLQNTTQFLYELQKAGKHFELMLYPKQKHAFRDKTLDYHRQQVILDFVKRTLK